ncbi:MAG: efflux transporter outer membrane subunit [Alphaproteobacteria bacterium]
MPGRPRGQYRATWAIALALATGACTTVGPNFETPAPPQGAAAAGYAMTGDATPPGVRLDAAASPAGPWWRVLGLVGLDEVMQLALANNQGLAEANAALERAQAEADSARGQLGPQADLNASARKTRINSKLFGFSGFTPPTIGLLSVGGNVNYDLDLFGARRRATEQARAMVEVARHEADAARLTLTANVARQAMTIAALRAQITAIEAVIADDRRIFEMVRAAQAEGGVPLSDLVLIYRQLTDSEASLPRLQKDLASARHQLALLVGRAPAEWTPPDFALDPAQAVADVPLALPSALVRSRPDILAAEAELHAATAAIGIAQANRYPDIRLTATLTQTATTPEGLFGYSGSGWNLFSGLSAPVFNGGTLKARQRAAEAEARVALARYQSTILRAFVQVSDALSAASSDHAELEADRRSLAAEEGKLRTAHAAYDLGGASLRQVIEVQQLVNRARQTVARSQGKYDLDMIQLYAAVASDWRTSAETVAAATP